MSKRMRVHEHDERNFPALVMRLKKFGAVSAFVMLEYAKDGRATDGRFQVTR